MTARLLLAFCALLVPGAAAADVRVMCYGDSLTAGDQLDPERSYPGQLQRLRPDLDVMNEGLPGDVSDDFERFRGAITDWTPELVVLMLGTNDAVCRPGTAPFCDSAAATPERTVTNLLRMADEARGAGATVVILTPPPTACDASCAADHARAFELTMRDAFTARVADELRRTRLPAGVRLADLRARFTDASWQSVSLDGVHPSPDGNRMIATFVAAHIPARAAAKRAAPKRQVAREPDPFLRSPQPHSSPR